MHTAKIFGLFIVWNLAVSVALALLPGPAALATGVVLTGAFVWRLVGQGEHVDRVFRIRPLRGAALGWTLAAILPLQAFNWALGEVYVRLVPVPPENFDPFARLMDEPAGRLAVTLLAVAAAPLIEELIFRGMTQRRLERRLGPAGGIAATALLFAIVHFLPWIFPLHFFLGLAFGYAVYATRSVWAGVILHAANNGSAMVGLIVQPDPPEQLPTLWTTGPNADWWTSVTAAIVTGLLLALVARGLWNARPAASLRPAAADG